MDCRASSLAAPASMRRTCLRRRLAEEVSTDGRRKADKKLCLFPANIPALQDVPRFVGSVSPNLREGGVQRLWEQAGMALEDVAKGGLWVAGEIPGDAFEGSHGVIGRAG